MPEMFNYWVGAGRIDVGFLGAAQIDRYGNINTTVIGPYEEPKVRLPGAGGAPEIAAASREVYVLLRHSSGRSSSGSTSSPRSAIAQRAQARRHGLDRQGPDGRHHRHGRTAPEPGGLRARAGRAAPGGGARRRREATGWDLRVRDPLETTEPVTDEELDALRKLRARET